MTIVAESAWREITKPASRSAATARPAIKLATERVVAPRRSSSGGSSIPDERCLSAVALRSKSSFQGAVAEAAPAASSETRAYNDQTERAGEPAFERNNTDGDQNSPNNHCAAEHKGSQVDTKQKMSTLTSLLIRPSIGSLWTIRGHSLHVQQTLLWFKSRISLLHREEAKVRRFQVHRCTSES